MRIGKLLAAIFGSLILLSGAAMTTGGAIALAVTDGNGWINAPTARVETDTAAVVGADIYLDLGDAIDEQTYVSFSDIPARIEVDSRNGKDVFIGVAAAEDVASYLRGTAHARADFFDDDIELFTSDGGTVLVSPAAQPFWVASATDGSLDWDLESGNWSVVIANADGSSGVDVAVTGSARIPFVEAIGIGLLVFGVMAIVGGAVMLYFGVRSDPRAQWATPAQPTPPAPSDTTNEPVIVS
ncbi:MAG TPA: hypothetical protein VLG28_03770 [Acidimicrobiia bacterium]|jgi:hypothetical protein|nr:hypothetical protein [Acidimicrobiia bacterium]